MGKFTFWFCRCRKR